MNIEKLERLKNRFVDSVQNISPEAWANYTQAFEIEYTHNSTAIEGNTLTLIETKVLLEDGISVGGKSLREIYEVVNHQKAFTYIKEQISKGKPLSEDVVKDIHSILMENIIVGGIYRMEPVKITGANHTPPTRNEMYFQIKEFYAQLPEQELKLNPIELAAWTHAEFVRIHPFLDGNGRTSRLLMNYQLMSHGYFPISIAKENRLDYYTTLDEYAVSRNLEPFSEMVFTLEEKRLKEMSELISEEQDFEPEI